MSAAAVQSAEGVCCMSFEYPYDNSDLSPEVIAFLRMLRMNSLREVPDKDLLNLAKSMPTDEFRAFIHTLAVHNVCYAYLGDLEIDDADIETIIAAAKKGSRKFDFGHGDFSRMYTASVQKGGIYIDRWGDEEYPDQVDTFAGLSGLLMELTCELEDQYLPDDYVAALHAELEKHRIEQIFQDIHTHEKIARDEENSGRTGFLPLGEEVTAPSLLIAEEGGPGAVCMVGKNADVLFLPKEGYEEVRIFKSDGTEIEVPLPSRINYRNMADISPGGDKLAVVSNVRARVISLDSGESTLAMEGPWMTGVVCLEGEFMIILTEGGTKKLYLSDSDAAELASVKNFSPANDYVSIGCSPMLHILDMKGPTKFLYSIECTAQSMETVMNGKVVVLRRSPWGEGIWGTVVLGTEGGKLAVLAKYPRDIGKVFQKNGVILSERGFQLIGLSKALDNMTLSSIGKIDDSIEIKGPPPPPAEELLSRNSLVQLKLVDMMPPAVELPATGRSDLGLKGKDWLPESSKNDFFLILRYNGGAYDLSLSRIQNNALVEIPLSMDIRTDRLSYEYSTDAELLLMSMIGGNYIVRTATGETERVSDQYRGVESAEIIDENTFMVLSRLNQENSQLDIFHREGEGEEWKVVSSLPAHAFTLMRYLHDDNLVLLSFKIMPKENSVVVFFCLNEDLQPIPLDTVDLTMQALWFDSSGSYIQTRTGLVYGIDILKKPESPPAPALEYSLPTGGKSALVFIGKTMDIGISYGYIDKSGNVVIAPRFANAQGFRDVNAGVGLLPHRFCGLVNRSGSFVLPAHASWIGSPSEGFRRIAFAGYVSSEEPQDALFGIIGSEGRWLVPPKYSMVFDVREGRAVVQFMEGDENWVGVDGNRLSGDSYQICGDFSEGMASAMKNDLNGYIDSDGKVIIDFKFRTALPFYSGAAGVKREDDLWRCIDTSGKELSRKVYDEFFSHVEGFAVVRTGDRWGYLDAQGFEPFGMGFDRTYSFTTGLAAVISDDSWGFLTAEGKLVSEKGWDGTFLPAEGMGAYKKNELFGYVNREGEIVTEPRFPSTYAYSEGLSAVLLDGKWGYIDRNGQLVIEPRFAEVRDFREGLAPVRETGEGPWGFIDREGNIVIEPRFREAYIFSSGLAVVGI